MTSSFLWYTLETLALFLPFLFSLYLFLTCHNSSKFLENTLVIVLVTLNIALTLSIYIMLPGEPQHLVFGNWLSMGTVRLDFAFRLDALNTLLQAIGTLFVSIAIFFSLGYMNRDQTPRRFIGILFLLDGFFKLFFLADGFFLTLAALVFILFASGVLTAYYYSDLGKVQRAGRGMLLDLLGLFTLLVAGILIITAYGGDTYAFLAKAAAEGGKPEVTFWCTVLLAVFLVFRAAQVPFHTWCLEMSAAPSPATALFQGALSTFVLGLIFIRLRPVVDVTLFSYIFWIIGSISMVISAVIGMLQWNVKHILAYIWMNRVSFFLMALPLLAPERLVNEIFLLSAALFVLFLGTAIIIRYLGDEQQLGNIGRLYNRVPLVMGTTALAFFALLPLPLSPEQNVAQEILRNMWLARATKPLLILPLIMYLLGEGVAAALAARYFLRLFVLKPLAEQPENRRSAAGKVPLEMPVALLAALIFLFFVSHFAILSGENLASLKWQWQWPFLLINIADIWPVSIAALLGFLAVFIYLLRSDRRRYFPGQYFAGKYEYLLHDAYYRVIAKPVLYITDLLFGRIIGEFLPDFIKKSAGYLAAGSGYLGKMLYRGDIRYHVTLFFLALLTLLYLLGGEL